MGQGYAVRLLAAAQNGLLAAVPAKLTPWLLSWMLDLFTIVTSIQHCSKEQHQALKQQATQQLPGLRAQLLQAAAAWMRYAEQRQQEIHQQGQHPSHVPWDGLGAEVEVQESTSCAVCVTHLISFICSTPVQPAELLQARLHLLPILVTPQSASVHLLWLKMLTRWDAAGAG